MADPATNPENLPTGTNPEPEPEPTPEPEPVGWKAHIPEDSKDAKFWNNVKDEADLVKQFANLQKLRGNSISVPGEDATDDDWRKVYGKLGRPEDPEGYEVNLPDHEGMLQWNPKSESWIKETAHELGLNGKQTQKLVDRYADLIVQEAIDGQAARNARVEELSQRYGDTWERKTTLGKRALSKVGGDDFANHLESMGLLQDPDALPGIIRLGTLFEEQNFIDGRVGGMSKGDAQGRLDAIMRDMSHAYFNGDDPAHDAAVKEVDTLSEIVYGA